MKPNMDLRFYAKGHGVALWQVAQRKGVSANTLLNWLRIPFDEKAADEFRQIVDEISKESR